MNLKWFPWRFLVSRLARSYGFLDPIQWLTRMRGFAHPSEVSEPVELLRAGVLFHARGLINTKAIQHNLDWVWPFWIERQFNPGDAAFVPRGFSFSHINLTHRNWTAVGLPDLPCYSIVDPRGLVTPFHDSWSVDFWLVDEGGLRLLPSKLEDMAQELVLGDNLLVRSHAEKEGWHLNTEVSMEMDDLTPCCVIRASVMAPAQTQLAVVVRPYNPEGISFIDSIEKDDAERLWCVNGSIQVRFSRKPTKCYFSNYRKGDVAHVMGKGDESSGVTCPVSMASGAALFPIPAPGDKPLEVRIPVRNKNGRHTVALDAVPPRWTTEIAKCSRLRIPDPSLQKLYDTAVASLILHSPEEVYPGPYTYKRFWFRDAAFILNALITLGAYERVKRCLDLFPSLQTLQGYFRSQEGEWDSNGEALWIMDRYLQLTGGGLSPDWKLPVEKGARWIMNKRLPKDDDAPHGGLLPAGFSAEHLGPNDYYYWDDFWGVAGLRCAARMLESSSPEVARAFAAEADEFMGSIVRSFRHIPTRRNKGAISASPHRRMDAGAIGSLVADYPLQLLSPGDERLMKTVRFLQNHCWVGGGFFQDMIHSGINAYLTLHVAQVLLRAGDLEALTLVDAVARMASPTGQWPEAIHPRTGGGCMGDGQHIWAAAEWALMIRNLFVREEGDGLVLGAGIFPRWLARRETISFGPTLTPFGAVALSLAPDKPGQWVITVNARWRGKPPLLTVRVPGQTRVTEREPSREFLIEADA